MFKIKFNQDILSFSINTDFVEVTSTTSNQSDNVELCLYLNNFKIKDLLYSLSSLLNMLEDTSIDDGSNDLCIGGHHGSLGYMLDSGQFAWESGSDSKIMTASKEDSISLFYHYFTAYKILVEQHLPPELKQEITSTDWWNKFLQELPKLETIYKDLVAKGEIEEVVQ